MMTKKEPYIPKQGTSWKDLKMESISPSGTAACYKTGGWRAFRPVHNKDKCINCLQCWIYCPDSSVIVEDGKIVGYDYDHCKGCGICAEVCPKKIKAITMEKEVK